MTSELSSQFLRYRFAVYGGEIDETGFDPALQSIVRDCRSASFRYPETMANEYVEQIGGEFMLAGSRIGLASIVAAWKEGLSPESIRDEFPTLNLDQVYGAIAYYLRNQIAIDSYLATLAADFHHRARRQAALYPEIASKLRAAKETAQQ